MNYPSSLNHGSYNELVRLNKSILEAKELLEEIEARIAASNAVLNDIEQDTTSMDQNLEDLEALVRDQNALPFNADGLNLTYVPAGDPGEGQVQTVQYLIAGVPVKTATLTYDINGNLTSYQLT